MPMPMCPGAKALAHDYFYIWAHGIPSGPGDKLFPLRMQSRTCFCISNVAIAMPRPEIMIPANLNLAYFGILTVNEDLDFALN